MASSEHQVSSVPPPPPGPAPPPPPPLAPGGSVNSGSNAKGVVWKKPSDGVPPEEINDRLLADIRAGVSLKPTKTKDRSSAVIRRKGNFK
ncbi:AGAP010642-PA-like protein [Anopheles sinensis]|uniref:AGAP010642-PA-like protein n=1 Tax=Anopheles sinensis TaxID=74873 RepID=A0A084WLT0_ANOSI|nr:AGAP010642-PA-like protein [Anopheles sinensis]